MDRKETIKIIASMKAVYPSHFQRYSQQDISEMVAAWHTILEDLTYEEASAGLKIYIRSDQKGFPPTPGQVLNAIAGVKTRTTYTAEEAWALVYKAIENSSYNSEKEFDKLPMECQRAVGSAANLKEMATLDRRDVETVEKSHFIRIYDVETQRTKNDMFVSAGERQLLGGEIPQKRLPYREVPEESGDEKTRERVSAERMDETLERLARSFEN